LGQVIDAPSFLGCSKSSDRDTSSALAIFPKVSNVGFPLSLKALLRLVWVVPISSAIELILA